MSLPEFQRSVLPLITLMMEAVQTSKTLVNSYHSTWCYNTTDSHLWEQQVFLSLFSTRGGTLFSGNLKMIPIIYYTGNYGIINLLLTTMGSLVKVLLATHVYFKVYLKLNFLCLHIWGIVIRTGHKQYPNVTFLISLTQNVMISKALSID
jgi:hypothetical protein